MKFCFQFTIRVYVCACETGKINVFKPLIYNFTSYASSLVIPLLKVL